MLLNVLRCTGKSPQHSIFCPQISLVLRLKPCSNYTATSTLTNIQEAELRKAEKQTPGDTAWILDWFTAHLSLSLKPKRTRTDKISVEHDAWYTTGTQWVVGIFLHGYHLQETRVGTSRTPTGLGSGAPGRCYGQENPGVAPHALLCSPCLPHFWVCSDKKKKVDPTDNTIFVQNVQFSLV